MDMKKAFVSLGIGVLVVTGLIQSGIIDVNQVFTMGDSAQDVDLAGKTLDEKWSGNVAQNQLAESTDQIATGQATQQPTHNESEWVKVKEKTCEIAWNNKDFKDGWCTLYRFPPGEYRFNVRSSLQLISNDGGRMMLPPEGVSIEKWREADNAFADYFSTWNAVQSERIGMIIFKINGESPLSEREISLNKESTLHTSFNSVLTEQSWKKCGYNGKITIEILKKKT